MAAKRGSDDAALNAATWTSPVDAKALDAVRRPIEDEVSTLSGFRRRVRTKGEWSVLGLVIGGPILLYQIARWIWVFFANADGDRGAVWHRFVQSASLWWTVAAVLLLIGARVSVVTRIRREYRWFRREGWIAFQAPTGWVDVQTDGASLVGYDHRSIEGPAAFPSRKLSDPIVLVSGPRMPPAAYALALDVVRTSIARRVHGEEAMSVFNRERKILRATSADGWFTGASGCYLGQGSDRLLTAVIPRPFKRGRRHRLADITLSGDEISALGAPA
jgi:hypothetical protein